MSPPDDTLPPGSEPSTEAERTPPRGLLDPDSYGRPLPEPAAADPAGAEIIPLHGGPPKEAESIVEDDDPDALAPPPSHLLESAVEALLLAADGPVSLHLLNSWLAEPGEPNVRQALRSIAARLDRQRGGWRLIEVAKGWQLRTDVRFARWVARMRGGRPQRLSNAAMDVLSILAYRQPCTRSEVDQLRGVDSGGVLRLLCDRGLAAVMGRKDVPGRPLLYGTTKNFLTLFGLRDLSDLPTLRDLRELRRDDERLPPGAAELLGITPEQLGRALGLSPQDDDDDDSILDDDISLLDDDPTADEGSVPTQTHLFAVADPDPAE